MTAPQIHFLNCGFAHPLGAKLFPRLFEPKMVCRCILIEHDDGLILIDAGLSIADLADPSRLGRMGNVLGIQGNEALAAVHQIRRLGLDPSSVQHVILSHLDLDHASGLVDFPNATVHVSQPELDAALHPKTWAEKQRYRSYHWSHKPIWRVHQLTSPTEIAGLPCIPVLIAPVPIYYVPLPGHTRGHCGVLIDTADQKILHCGDLYYAQKELAYKPSIAYKIFQYFTHVDAVQAYQSRQMIQTLQTSSPSWRITSSHDPTETH